MKANKSLSKPKEPLPKDFLKEVQQKLNALLSLVSSQKSQRVISQ